MLFPFVGSHEILNLSNRLCHHFTWNAHYTILQNPEELNNVCYYLCLFSKCVCSIQVKACAEAVICLSAEMGECVIKVTIGDDHNTISSIHTNTGFTSVKTPGILDCKELRPFWITWYNGADGGIYIKVGYGPYAGGSSPFLVRSGCIFMYYIASASLKTESNYEGIWQFKDESGKLCEYFFHFFLSKIQVMQTYVS